MKRLLTILAFGLALSFTPSVSLAQSSGMTLAEKQRNIAALADETLAASRAPQIYVELRQTMRDLIPNIKEALADGTLAKAEPEEVEKFRAVVPILESVVEIADQIDPELTKNKSAMIADFSALLAKDMTEEQLQLATAMLRSPGTRKGFNVVYAISRLLTGYSQDDLRQSYKLTAWMENIDFSKNPFTDKSAPPPPRERVAKAEAIMADLIRVSRVDSMVADAVRFTKDVLLKVDTLKPSDREAISAGLQQFEFGYNLGKSMAVAVAPSGIASIMNDEQLAALHLLVLSPLMAKSFDILHNVIREGTTFTVQDFAELHRLAEKAEKLKSPLTPEQSKKLEGEFEAMGQRWTEKLMTAITPDARARMESALAAFAAIVAAEEGENGGDAVPPPATDPNIRKL